MKITLLLLFILHIISPSNASTKVCPSVEIHGHDEEVKLTETEKLLVCGDPKSESYKVIPPYQASYFFTAFLQSRGFLRPEFNTENGVLHVHTGPLRKMKKLQVDSDNKKERQAVKKELKRRYLREKLNPNLLDALEKRSKKIVGERGYPCADAKALADAEIQQVTIALNEGNHYTFGEVDKEPIKGLEENALDRYYPYRPQDPFNEQLLKLNEKRLLRSEVLQGTYYLNNCAPDMKEFRLSQYFILGPPRTIRFGVGASTELGPMARLRWSNNRYHSMASILSLNAQASVRSQSLNGTADIFFWKHKPRRSLLTQIELSRESQIDYEQSLLSFRPHMKWTYDSTRYLQTYTLGPTYEASTYHSKVDPNTKTYSAVNINGSSQLMSHSYEFFDIHPQEGSVFGFTFDFRHPSLGFSDPLVMLAGTYSEMRELGFFGKGAIIGAYRFNAGTTWVDDEVSLKSLPPSVKFYGGGSDDVRGFLLNTLPDNDGLGALTKLELKLEVRKTYLILEQIEAFGFVDSAYFGEKSWDIDPRLWYSPGLGLRWLSKLGLVQGYVARGYVTNPYIDKGNFYYAGIGGTF
ncbi:autotransporter assembly complex protein TamA [Peredibacter sp. HCB2-198]|uniref:autotransporter assembly complex protein TamA n=1 Tax=Peredibacter sp. HCB2-198 TaxID=3383025 RepID=UPI0038B6108C